MELSIGKNTGKQGDASHKDIQEMLLKMAIGLAINFIGRQIKKRQEFKHERKKAGRKVARLQRKGKEVPLELAEEATRGLSRREKKKLAGKAKKKKKKRVRKVAFLLLVIVGIAVAVKAAGK